MVTVALPSFALLVVETVKVAVPLEPSVTDVGLNKPDAPVGRPLADSVTVPLNPATAETVIVYDVPFPRTTVCFAGEALIAKSGAGFTVM
jgi:hypothetical protein